MATRTTLQATNKATTATTTTLTTSAKTGAHNRTSTTDASSRDTDTSPDGPSMTSKFKYNSRDKNMMGNLRRTINYMKEGAQNREAARRLPKFVNRTIDEVSEDNIATMSITEIQTILNEDINLIYDALVIGDYIEDEEEA